MVLYDSVCSTVLWEPYQRNISRLPVYSYPGLCACPVPSQFPALYGITSLGKLSLTALLVARLPVFRHLHEVLPLHRAHGCLGVRQLPQCSTCSCTVCTLAAVTVRAVPLGCFPRRMLDLSKVPD